MTQEKLNFVSTLFISGTLCKSRRGNQHQRRGADSVDLITIIVIAIMVIFVFPLVMRGVGCLIRSIASFVLIAGAIVLLTTFL